MTRDEATAEAKRRQASDREGTWIATERGSEWTVARIGVAPTKETGTATKPPPVAPREDAYTLCSLACDMHITQLVNGNKGVHAMLPKSQVDGIRK